MPRDVVLVIPPGYGCDLPHPARGFRPDFLRRTLFVHEPTDRPVPARWDWNERFLMMQTPKARIGVVGAGRVGAVLAAALRTAGHEIVAVAGESPASRTRIETL